MDPLLTNIAIALYTCGAVKDYRMSENGLGFTLDIHREQPHAPRSPFYVSLRTASHPEKPGPITAELLKDIGQALYQRLVAAKLPYDRIVGIPRAGETLAKALYDAHPKKTRTSVLSLRKDSRREGARFEQVVLGDYTFKDRVLLVDDLVSFGGSKSEAAGLLRKTFRFVVDNCLVVIDRRPFRLRTETIAGLNIHALFKIEELIELYRERQMLSDDVANRIQEYLQTA
jgi:orotate phosphoribosyltransferase